MMEKRRGESGRKKKKPNNSKEKRVTINKIGREGKRKKKSCAITVISALRNDYDTMSKTR